MSGHVQYRGLPPPPHGDFICESGNPPPCPRDMYSHSGIYDTIPANQGEYMRRSGAAPAPPRRSPSTRLSTGSRTSSSSSGIYDDTALYMDEAHHSPQHQVQPPQHPAHISPAQMSPRLQKKMGTNPMVSPHSPSHQNPSKPFTYIMNLPGSPKSNRRSSDGKYHDVPDFSPPGDPTYEPIGQPQNFAVVDQYKVSSNGQYGAPASPDHQTNQDYYSQGQGHPATPASPGHQGQGYYGSGQSSPASNGSQYGAPASPGHQGYYGQQGQSPNHGQLPAMQQLPYSSSPTHRTASPTHRTASPPPLPRMGKAPGSAPNSPVLQRQSSLNRKKDKMSSPVMPRHSADPRILPQDPGAMYTDSVPSKSDGRSGHGPPSFPAPPPPLPVAARFVAATLENNRPPSPPLPPPPPEMISPHTTPHKVPPPVIPPPAIHTLVAPPSVAAPPTVPPPPNVVSPPPPPPPPISKIPGRPRISTFEIGKKQPKGDDSHEKKHMLQHALPHHGQAAIVRPNQQKQQQLQSRNLAEELSKVTLRTIQSGAPPQPEPQAVVEEPRIKASPPKPLEKTKPAATREPEPAPAAFLPKLKSTGAKPWEKGSNSSLSSMEIDLDEIDFSQIPGYTPINASIPNWKRDMVEKKNREKLEEYVNEMRRRKAEEEKWKNVPEWKRKLLVEKEKTKREDDEVKIQVQREDDVKRKEEKRQQITEQRMEEEEMASLPAWKREILCKRGGAPKNWGDEREGANEGEEEEEQ